MKIGDLCTYAPKSSIKAGDAIIDGRYMFFTSSSDENKRYSDYQLDCEGIIMGTGGNATLHYYNGKFATSTDCVVLLSNETIRCKYLYYFFLSNMDILESGFKGAGLKHTNKNYINSINISSVPSFEMQDRVIKVLDKVQSIIDKRQQQLEKLDELVKSRFIEMFVDIVLNPFSWEKDYLGVVCDVRDGTHDSPHYHSTGFPLVTSKNVTGGKIDLTDCSLISEADFNKLNERANVDMGDIIMPMIGTVGKPVIVNVKPNFAIKNVSLIKFKDNSRVLNTFIRSLLQSDYFDDAVLSKIRGGTQKFISLGDIRKLVVIVPPMELQNQFADFIEQVDKLKFEIKQSLEKSELLKKALMQKYFG